MERDAALCVECDEPMGVETTTRNGQSCHIRCPRDYPGHVGDGVRRRYRIVAVSEDMGEMPDPLPWRFWTVKQANSFASHMTLMASVQHSLRATHPPLRYEVRDARS